MRIAMIYLNKPPFYIDTHEGSGLGGSESGFVNTFKQLVAMGHRVEVFNLWPFNIDTGAWSWSNISQFDRDRRYDVVLSLRHAEVFDHDLPNVGLKVLFLADTESHGLGNLFRSGRVNLAMAVSHWQKEKIAAEEEIHDDNWIVTSNGITPDNQSEDKIAKYRGRCLFTATPERGLSTLLELWPRVLAKVPWATLEIFSSYIGWGEPADRNAELNAREYAIAKELGVINPIHGGADQLRLAQSLAEFYVYPTNFRETRCMSVLESQYQMAIPIVTGRAALLETVQHGVTGYIVPSYGADGARYRELFVNLLTEQLLRDPNEMWPMRRNCRNYASQFLYPELVKSWAAEWEWRLLDKGWSLAR